MRLAAGAAAAAAAIVFVLVGASTGAATAVDPPARPATHGSATPSPAPDHAGHDMSDMTEEEMAEEETAGMDHGGGHEHATTEDPAAQRPGDHGEHGGTPDTVSPGTRTAVLGGFAAANAGVLGGALLLRRHDRRHPRRGARPARDAR
ncbi:hypothetical protein [Nocardioides sp.]|uniref:hypothetical protein n=1 Tax=Nocardioides sp. TaxID=35761 RepID=UPI0026189E37|nr:hypothetical protein [Nocardioides sp.]MDI6912544.1 hypothetical protein [Nocardioides sp.]